MSSIEFISPILLYKFKIDLQKPSLISSENFYGAIGFKNFFPNVLVFGYRMANRMLEKFIKIKHKDL